LTVTVRRYFISSPGDAPVYKTDGSLSLQSVTDGSHNVRC
jgi:hypothetical protein